MDAETLKKKGRELGADLVGITSTEALAGLETRPGGLLSRYKSVVSMGVGLPAAVFRDLAGQPSPEYVNVYETANRILDEIAFKTARYLQDSGFGSLPIPASQVLDDEHWAGAISHKAVARVAGLGWQGKSLLIVTPQFGPAVRLVTVLTNADLAPDAPMKNRCGKCNACAEACPVSAIRGVSTRDRYASREEALDFNACMTHLTRTFSGLPHIGRPVCGLCIQACPHLPRD